MALYDVPDEQLDEVTAIMRRDGFYTLLDRDRRLIEGVAALGICCSTLTPYAALARPFLANNGLDYDATLAATDRLHERHGLGRVWRDGNGAILPSV